MIDPRFTQACDTFLRDAGAEILKHPDEVTSTVHLLVHVIARGFFTAGQIRRATHRLRRQYRSGHAVSGTSYQVELAAVLVGDTATDFLTACGSRTLLEAAVVLEAGTRRIVNDLRLGMESEIRPDMPEPVDNYLDMVKLAPAAVKATLEAKLSEPELGIMRRLQAEERIPVEDGNAHLLYGLAGKSLCAFYGEQDEPEVAAMPPYEVWVEGVTGIPVELCAQYTFIAENLVPELHQALRHADGETLLMIASLPKETQVQAAATLLQAHSLTHPSS
jgi:hypothetical protein